ncbi:MOSC domain-containing protein [Cellulomonas bogoriensis]|uniref:Molybdenum cofactor biosysynthesis protein n=1 Tax=Cellulomonas bogoriensis 69B4 = DSM 16987 TaxID=1386082 RepID=A0A0A0BWY5_9CELL|nr:MOSC domain-containing protein [Cellulomonas bogoriensis]KGM12908.1 molybdenum cofactor biosysynthesis protein [Cellulomonas bogoriensis 69B4 = DSM 16987]
MSSSQEGRVLAVARDDDHRFSKVPVDAITLLAGVGVEGDAHAGATVKHQSRAGREPAPPNLRQVHLIHAELFDELRTMGFDVPPAGLGENVTTRGVDLLGLPRGTRLHLGGEAVVEVTGLRNPCAQINAYMPGLLKAVSPRDAEGNIVRKTGVMSVVLTGGVVRAGDLIRVELPARPWSALERV